MEHPLPGLMDREIMYWYSTYFDRQAEKSVRVQGSITWHIKYVELKYLYCDSVLLIHFDIFLEVVVRRIQPSYLGGP